MRTGPISYKQILAFPARYRAAFCGLFLLVSAVFHSCKKDADSQPPEAQLTSPSENSVFSVYDTIIVSGSASDENKLVSVDIVLVDANMLPVQPGISVYLSSNTVSFTKKYPLYDIHLASGLYRMKLSVSDGMNVTNTYRNIYINELPRERKSIYVLTAGNGKTNISTLDTQGISYQFFIPGDYSGSAVSSWYQQMYVCGKYNGNFNSVLLVDHSIAWSIQPLISSSPFFSGVFTDEKDVYVSYYEGTPISYDFRGQTKTKFISASENAHPQRGFRLKDYFLLEERDVTLTNRKLIVFYVSTGQPKQEMTLKQEVAEFFKKDETHVFIFGNNAGQGKIELFDVLSNSAWAPYSNFPAGKILSVAQVDEVTFLIGHENKTLYKYQYGGSGLLSLISTLKADHLLYDAENGEILIAENATVKRYSYPGVQLIQTVLFPDSVLALHALYNK